MHAVAPERFAVDHMDFGRLLSELAASGRRLSLAARDAVYEATDAATNVYLIHEGQVRSHQVGPNGSRRLVEILGPGDWCGAPALARLAHYGERTEAAVPSSVTAVPVERLLSALQQHPSAAMDLVQQLAAKLGTFREQAAALVFEDCNHRLIRTLQRLSDSPAASVMGDDVVLRITHQQLAQAVGVARETISLALSALRRRNLLRTGRNQLIYNPQRLGTEAPAKA